jgi:hypothetical protein
VYVVQQVTGLDELRSAADIDVEWSDCSDREDAE